MFDVRSFHTVTANVGYENGTRNHYSVFIELYTILVHLYIISTKDGQ